MSDPFWPNWLSDAESDLPRYLEITVASYERLRQKAEADYTYKHVMQLQINAVLDGLVAHGFIDKSGRLLRSMSLPLEHEFAQLRNYSSHHQLLGLLCAAKRIGCFQLLDAARSSLFNGSLLVSFICLRSLLEQIAHFDYVVRQIPSSMPSDLIEANKLLWEIHGILVKATYSTRVDWESISSLTAQEVLQGNKIKYRVKENRQDREADQILDAIDGLAKRIKGTRAVYEILCEFAHPNVGVVLGLTRSVDHYADTEGVHWIQKTISRQPPICAVQALRPVLASVFFIVSESLVHFETLLGKADQHREKLLALTQLVVREVLEARRDLSLPYSPCPCGSESKTKFCCGSKTAKR